MKALAQHEAAHGIVWYLFKEFWTAKELTIEPITPSDKMILGGFSISARFNVHKEFTIQRANELSTIALAGIIGQNIDRIKENEKILIDIAQVNHFKQVLDVSGSNGDFEIFEKYLVGLTQKFMTDEYSYVKNKIMDLASLFQDHRIQQIHCELVQRLIEKKSINGADLVGFFENFNFQEYIEYNNLDINFINYM